jgi:methylenetetrahydrofolate reductase (NADPH)
VTSKDGGRAMLEVLRRPRYEVIPLEGVEEQILSWVPTEVTVTVTASPSQGLDPTVELAERLASAGYRAVPHLSARLIADGAHLTEVLDRLQRAGVRDVFAIAGDQEEPAGLFSSALDLLRAMSDGGHHLDQVGITGYPESHPFIDDDVTVQAMWDKRHYATYIVSNVCFDARRITTWVERVRRRGVELPIYVGVAGVTDQTKLLRISRRIGVGESLRFLARHQRWLVRLFVPGLYSPTRLIARLSPELFDSTHDVRGVHVYTFNDIERTERWRRRTIERLSPAA